MLNFGLATLFFLPVIESFNRKTGFIFLLFGSLLFAIDVFRGQKIKFDIIETTWLILLAIFSFSILNSLSYIRSFTETLRYLSYFFIFISFRNAENKKELTNFLFSFVIINSLILTGFAFLSSFHFFNWLIPKNTMNLYFSNFGHNRLSDILIFSIPLSAGLIIKSTEKRKRILYWCVLILFTISLFLTLGRGAIFSLTLTTYLILYISGKNKAVMTHLTSGMESIFKLSIIFGVFAIIYISINFIYSNFLQANPQYQKFSKPAIFELRLEYLRQATIAIKKYPYFGTGLDTFRYTSMKYQSQPHTWSFYTHNHFLEIFSETGIIGGVIFSLLITLLILYASSNLRIGLYSDEYILKLTIFIAMTASAIHSFIDYGWHFLSVFMLFFISSALLTAKSLDSSISLKKGYKNLKIFCRGKF